MYKLLLISFIAALLWGCAATQSGSSSQGGRQTPTHKKVKGQSVPGTFCGDRNVSDDF